MALQETQRDGRREEWIYDFERGVLQKVIDRDDFQFSSNVRWTPDSKSLVYAGSRTLGGERVIVRVSPGQSGTVDTLGRGSYITSTTFTASGDTAVAQAPDPLHVWHLVLFGIDPRSAPVQIGNSKGWAENPGISPDGKWLTYDSDENGDHGQIFAEPFPPTGRRIQVTPGGGTEAAWSRRGDALFYRKDMQILRVPVTPGAANPFGAPKVFVEGNFAQFPGRTFSVHPDGKRVLLKVLSNEQTSREIRVHTDLLAELKQLEAAASTTTKK
jgi:serine/threonine-protein kinase